MNEKNIKFKFIRSTKILQNSLQALEYQYLFFFVKQVT